MKINVPRILGATLTIIFLSGLVQTAQCALKSLKGVPLQEPTVTLKEPTAINRVYLLNGDRISGTVISLDKDALFLNCMLSKKLRIDMRAVMAVDFQPKTQKSFQPRKKEMDKMDFINGDKITGDVLSLSEKTITIKGEYGELVLEKEGLSHAVFGLRERLYLEFPREERNVAMLKLVNGDTISGKLLNFDDDVFHFTTKYSQELKIKSQHVSSLTFTRRPELDDYVKLLLHMNGANGSQTFTDETGKAVTVNGNAQIDTAQYKLGGASGLFDGDGNYVATDYLSIPNSNDWNFGTGDWTIDFWVRRNGAQDKGLIDATENTGNGWKIDFVTTGGVISSASNASGVWQEDIRSTSSIPDLTWTHVAIIRYGNTLTIYLDGVASGSRSVTGWNYTTSHPLWIANGFHGSLSGWLDEVRISKGVARWISSFIPNLSYQTSSSSADYYFKVCTNYEYIPDSNFRANPGVKKLEVKHIKDWHYFHVSANALDWKNLIDNFKAQSPQGYDAYIVDINEWNSIRTSSGLSQ